MDMQAAVALDVVHRFLEPVLPAATLDHLAPYFCEARRRLREATGGGAKLARWASKILVVREGPPLRPLRIDRAVQRTVYEALLREECLHVTYRPRGRDARDYELSPLGLLYRGSTTALVCTKLDDTQAARDEPRTFLLHRMVSATLVARPRHVPPGFDLEAYAGTGRHAFRLGDDIRLRALVNADAIASLQEAGLSDDQRLEQQPDGRYLLEATVAHTYALRVWILGFAEGVEVLAPKELRDEVARKLRAAAARYAVTPRAPRQRSMNK